MTAHHTYRSQVEFSSEQVDEDRAVTQFRQTPDRAVDLEMFGRDLRFPDGATFQVWAFQHRRGRRGFPSPIIRVREGEVFHARVEPSKGPHTIHWHGMEPDPRNDGVGHTSFEIGDHYTYQWQAEPGEPGDPDNGAAGSYFYHCHVNTVLHAQMGMFGMLVVDPVPHPDHPVLPGLTRRPFVDGPEYDCATETMLVPYSLDPRWHGLHHAAGLSGEDVGLNRFEPRHFYVLGGELDNRPDRDGVWAATSVRAVAPGATYPDGRERRPSLLRVLNANYLPVTMWFTREGSTERVAMAELVAHDGRPYRDTSSPTAPAVPLRDSGPGLHTHTLAFGAAERYDLLLHPPGAGAYRVWFRWEHWITGAELAVRSLPLVAG